MTCAVSISLNQHLSQSDHAEAAYRCTESMLDQLLRGEEIPVVGTLHDVLTDVNAEALDLLIIKLVVAQNEQEALIGLRKLVLGRAEQLIEQSTTAIYDEIQADAKAEAAISDYEDQQQYAVGF